MTTLREDIAKILINDGWNIDPHKATDALMNVIEARLFSDWVILEAASEFLGSKSVVHVSDVVERTKVGLRAAWEQAKQGTP